jgi:hypothetical protein
LVNSTEGGIGWYRHAWMFGNDRTKNTPPVLLDRIVFLNVHSSGMGDIFSVGVDGTGLTQLSATGTLNSCPIVSPDGRRIAFVGGSTVHVMGVDGSEPKVLAPPPSDVFGFVGCVAWSKDGKRLAFVRTLPAFALNPKSASILESRNSG